MPLLNRIYWEGLAVNHLPAWGLLEVLQRTPDLRGRDGQRHPLSAMLVTVDCAALRGFRGFQPLVQWLEPRGPAMWHLWGRCQPPVRQTYAKCVGGAGLRATRCVVEVHRAVRSVRNSADAVCEEGDDNLRANEYCQTA